MACAIWVAGSILGVVAGQAGNYEQYMKQYAGGYRKLRDYQSYLGGANQNYMQWIPKGTDGVVGGANSVVGLMGNAEEPDSQSPSAEKEEHVMHHHVEEVQHLDEEAQAEVKRFAEEQKWAGDDEEALRRVQMEHNETERRIQQARAEEQHRFQAVEDRLAHAQRLERTPGQAASKQQGAELTRKDNHSQATVLSAVLSAGAASMESQAERQHLERRHQEEQKHLDEEAKAEIQRFAEERRWAGNDTEALRRVQQQHGEAEHRIQQARDQEQRRFETATARLAQLRSQSKHQVQWQPDSQPMLMVGEAELESGASAAGTKHPLEEQRLKNYHAEELEHLDEQAQAEAKRLAEEQQWAGNDTEALQHIQRRHAEEEHRLAQARANEQARFEEAEARLAQHAAEARQALWALVEEPRARALPSAEAEEQPLQRRHEEEREHLDEEAQEEAKRFAEEQQWAGNDPEASRRVRQRHEETEQRLAKARAEEQRRFEVARARAALRGLPAQEQEAPAAHFATASARPDGWPALSSFGAAAFIALAGVLLGLTGLRGIEKAWSYRLRMRRTGLAEDLIQPQVLLAA